MTLRHQVRILSTLLVVGGLGITLGCVADRQAAQHTQTDGVNAVRQTREAVKEDVRTITQGTKERIQTEKEAAKQSVTGTKETLKQTTEEFKKEGAAIKQDVEELKQILQEPAK